VELAESCNHALAHFMAFASWAVAQVEGLLTQLADADNSDLVEDGGTQAHVALLYCSVLKQTGQDIRTAAAGRQFRADMENTGLIDALAEAAAAQLQ
jgi:hypothetical protein